MKEYGDENLPAGRGGMGGGEGDQNVLKHILVLAF